MRIRLFKANPSLVQASMAVAGVAVFRRTSSALKSVWVSSLLFGPRSRDFGGRDCRRAGRVVWRLRREAFGEVRVCVLDAVVVGIRHCVRLAHRGNIRVMCIRERSIVSVVDICASTEGLWCCPNKYKMIWRCGHRSLDHQSLHLARHASCASHLHRFRCSVSSVMESDFSRALI